MYLVIKNFFESRDVVVPYKKHHIGNIISTISLVLMLIVVGLVSCKFNYCLIVIGSESMTGSIDIGDAVIYEVYNNQIIEEGDILVFDKSGVVTVHRVVNIENIEGQIRYTTKGDANKEEDSGYVLDSNIIGIHRAKISFVGYPTLWINEMFK